ncbi:MAG TPA: class I SAM-dependent methyltransferase [Phycisphaerales bacterium]|nr:class I SAM-dependent methyltransferase [Phycisphaerales bacterium]
MATAQRPEGLLGGNCTGFELDDLLRVSRRSVNLFASTLGREPPRRAELEEEFAFIREFYRAPRRGVFGGIISPGDAVIINEFVRAIRPDLIIEIGVASGFSSLFILSSMKRHGLLDGNDAARLESYDLVASHGEGDLLRVGHVVERDGADLLPHWELRTCTTTIDLHAAAGAAPDTARRALAFVDGGHCHPWPLFDVFVLTGRMPPGSWILLQDVGLSERQLGSVIRLNSRTPAGYGFRGAQLLYEQYSGRKVRGIEACFNMAAIQVPQCRREVLPSLKQLLVYPPEKRLCEREQAFLETLANAS